MGVQRTLGRLDYTLTSSVMEEEVGTVNALPGVVSHVDHGERLGRGGWGQLGLETWVGDQGGGRRKGEDTKTLRSQRKDKTRFWN